MAFKIDAKEPLIARCIIRALRRWEKSSSPAPLIIKVEDINQLEDWAQNLNNTWDKSKALYIGGNFPFHLIDNPIKRSQTWVTNLVPLLACISEY